MALHSSDLGITVSKCRIKEFAYIFVCVLGRVKSSTLVGSFTGVEN